MLKKIKAAFNAGLSEEEYDRIEPTVEKLNMKTLQWVSLLMALLMVSLVIVTSTQLVSMLEMNKPAYFTILFFSCVTFLTARFFLPGHLSFTKPFYYFFLVVIIFFSVYIGVITNVNQRASTICVLLLAIPLLITDRPFRIVALMSAAVLLFCVTSYFCKDIAIFTDDVVNCVPIFVIGVGVTFAQQNMKYRTLNDRYIIDQNNMHLIDKQKTELEESRIAIMLSQIQPHFLYNTLTAIARLCDKDPNKAKKITLHFSEYLRCNLNALRQKDPIPFEKELEHVKNYLSIEQVRFGECLNVKYEIGTTDFEIPPLCLQPLVENAVKHGVGMREDGGTITIGTAELPDDYVITVSDDGVGFNPDEIPNDGTHIGIQSVKDRLMIMIKGYVDMESEPDRGTTVTIHIPKNKEEIS